MWAEDISYMRSHYTLTLSYQPCYRHYRTQCRLELSCWGPPVTARTTRLHVSDAPNLSGLCDSLVFSHALHLVGLSSTTVQQTFGTVSGPCPVVEQRCSIDGAPDFLIRRGAQDALPTDCHCMIGYLLPYHLGGLYSQ